MKSERFTLIEMLITMAVIAILAGIIIPAIMSVQNNGLISETQSRVTALKNAILQYEAEYGVLPQVSGMSTTTDTWYPTAYSQLDITTDTSAVYDELMEILTMQDAGYSGSGQGANPRNLVFLQPYGKPGTRYADSWDRRFRIKMDIDGDGKIVDPMDTTKVVYAKVLIYSFGSNYSDGTYTDSGKTKADGKRCDDIRSW